MFSLAPNPNEFSGTVEVHYALVLSYTHVLSWEMWSMVTQYTAANQPGCRNRSHSIIPEGDMHTNLWKLLTMF